MTVTTNDLLDLVVERLDEMEILILKLVIGQGRATRTLKEIQITMATQEQVDAIKDQLEATRSAVVANGVEIAKIGADFSAFITANPTITLAELQAKGLEVGNAVAEMGAALQAVDDLVPEQ